MPLQNFVDFLPPSVKAAWLNGVDQLKFTVFDDATTKALARTALQLDSQLVAAGVDAGVVNAAVVTLTGPITGFVRATGSKVTFVAITPNNGPATLNVNATGAAAVQAQDGSALTGGELSAPVIVEWTGAAWKIVAGFIGLDLRRSANEITAGVVPTNYFWPRGSVMRYGAIGDGNDDSAAIQRAVDVAEVSGGDVVFPAGFKWGIGTQVVVSSLFPVNLIGFMTVNPNATANASYIRPTASLGANSMIRYESPTIGVIADGGGGVIRGLSFMDDTNRTRTMLAALDLDSFAGGIVEDCFFHKLLGSAMRFGWVIQCKFTNIHVRYCGNTGQPGTIRCLATGSYQTQGCTITNLISEVNSHAPHILLASNTNDNKFVNLTFETNSSIDVDEGFNYITFDGLRNVVEAATFNRRPEAAYAVEFIAGAGRCVVANSVFDCNVGRAVLFNGDRNEVSGGYIVGDTSVVDPIVFAGVRNRVRGVHFFATRSFDINSADNEVSDCVFDAGVETAGFFLTVTAAGIRAKVCGNRFVGLPAGLGGLSINADGVYSNNVMSGGGGGSTGINVNVANAIVTGNYIANFTTALNPNTFIATSIIENNIGFVRRNQGATASVADGGTITHGISGTPTTAVATCSVSGQIVTIAAIGATTITVAIKNHDGTAGTTQTIHWNAAL